MIQAVLNGKSQGYEFKEDILTSTLFGMLKYISGKYIDMTFRLIYNVN